MAKTVVKKKTTKTKTKTNPYAALDFAGGFWKRHWKEAVIIPLLAFSLYWMSIPYGYNLDDQIVITGNQFTKKGVAGIWDILSTESFSGYFGKQENLVAGARYRPLSIVSFAIEQSIFGDKPHLRHFINILLYGICGLLLFRIFSVLFPKKDDNLWLVGIPFLAAVIYIFHPVHSEVVANIKGRDEIMSAIGSLAALFFALKFLPSRNFLWLVASGVALFLGLMSKENAITFVAVIPLTIYFFTKAKTKDYLLATAPSLIASIIYIIIRTNVIGYLFDSGIVINDLMNDPFIGMTGDQRIATIIYTLLDYLRLLVFPHPLTHDYYPYHIPIMEFTKPGVILSLAVYAGLAYVFFAGLKKKSIYAWAIGFFVITLSIVSNFFFAVGTFMNERFLYVPSIAFSLVTAWALIKYGFNSEKSWLKYTSLALLGILLAGYAYKTYERVPDWKDSLSLNSHAAKVSPNSARANCFMATALFEKARDLDDEATKVKLFQEAEIYAKRSLEIYPGYLAANQIYSGLVAERYQRDNNLEYLLAEFTKILSARPETEYVYQFCDYLNARAPAERMVEFYYHVGYEIIAQQKLHYPTAVQYLKLGEKIAPHDARILFALGQVLYKGGDQVQGTQYLERAYQLNPALRNVN